MSIFTDISAALDGRLNTLTNKPPIAWPNAPYTPSEGVLYLSVTHSPTATINATQDYIEAHGGIYQITVYAPSGSYKAQSLGIADDIADHFSAQRTLTYKSRKVKIRSVSQATPIRDGAWYAIPISVDYDCYTVR